MSELVLRNLSARLGGLQILHDVSLTGAAGTVTGLIGPNGAGKTTTFNICSGLIGPETGTVQLGEARLDGQTPAARAQAGLGRTFQRIALWGTMTVAENVSLGLELRFAGRSWHTQLRAGRRERTECAEVTARAMARCGVADLAAVPVRELSTGQRRLVELARATASGFRYLLLDEPSSGLDNRETAALGLVVSELAAEDGIGVLLVEHDMELVRDICPFSYVLDFGRLIYEGETTRVLTSDIVRAAYLGRSEVA